MAAIARECVNEWGELDLPSEKERVSVVKRGLYDINSGLERTRLPFKLTNKLLNLLQTYDGSTP